AEGGTESLATAELAPHAGDEPSVWGQSALRGDFLSFSSWVTRCLKLAFYAGLTDFFVLGANQGNMLCQQLAGEFGVFGHDGRIQFAVALNQPLADRWGGIWVDRSI